jgi:uncharacterized protein YegL
MEKPQPGEQSQSKKSSAPKLTREMIFLAEQAAEGGLKILPGNEWALHHPVDKDTRKEKLQSLLDGKCTATEVVNDIKPDALLYNVEDIKTKGLEAVSSHIRDLSAFIKHFDYQRFAEFVESMRGRNIPVDELDNLYSEITKTRVQKKVMDSYGQTGRRQIEEALQNEVESIKENITGLSRPQKVLKALKTDWLNENLGLATMADRDQIVSELSGDERQLYNELQSSYREYVQKGDEVGYKKLTDTIRESFNKIQKKVEDGQVSDSMQQLEKDLEEFRDQSAPPGSPEDSAIPPEDSDEYHTPPPSPGESKEKIQAKPIYEIDPALGGYYISGRKSYFDVDTKTWSKKKQLSPHTSSTSNGPSFTISGKTDVGLKSLPIPNTYTLDLSSLKTKGTPIEIFRDQNGCFYLKSNGSASFSVEFKKEHLPFIASPISEDLKSLHRGSLSPKTEAVISNLSGTPIQKAEQVRQYILANHFYPGGGDLQAAGALQYKLRNTSTGDNYLQNIDLSEYLECYSANTMFIAMMRRAGIPARLVVGYRVQGAQNGKSNITQNDGHAWSEIWDGKEWRRFDATPNAKPEDKKDKDKGPKKDPANEANDGGIEKPQGGGKNDGQNQPGQQQKGQQSGESGNPLDQMSDASDSQMQQSESQLQQAKSQMEKVNQQRQELNEKIQNTEKFKELSELQNEIEASELFDDLKKEMEEKIEAKEHQMKDEIKEELDQMVDDGFMDEKKRDEILQKLEQEDPEVVDHIQDVVDQESQIYDEYNEIRQEIAPIVDKWFEYFAQRLPKQDEIEFDQDSLTRQGSFDRRAVMKSRNLIFGTVKNPRQIKSSIKPKFLASVLVDVSGSMGGEKLESARKLLVFYSELFSRVSREFGYINFSIDTFSDSITPIKSFDQDYDSPQRYTFPDRTKSTIKARLMKELTPQGGTNMLDAIKKSSKELNKQVEDYPDYASSFYFVGDGGDTNGNAENIKKFLQINRSEHGFGEHMYSATLLGDESQRSDLADIFGDDHTNVVPNFDDLIEKSMDQFDRDLEEYLRNKAT